MKDEVAEADGHRGARGMPRPRRHRHGLRAPPRARGFDLAFEQPRAATAGRRRPARAAGGSPPRTARRERGPGCGGRGLKCGRRRPARSAWARNGKNAGDRHSFDDHSQGQNPFPPLNRRRSSCSSETSINLLFSFRSGRTVARARTRSRRRSRESRRSPEHRPSEGPPAAGWSLLASERLRSGRSGGESRRAYPASRSRSGTGAPP